MIIKRLSKDENESISRYICDVIKREREKKGVKGVYLVSFMDDSSFKDYIDIHIIKDSLSGEDLLINENEEYGVIMRTYYSSGDNYSEDFSDEVAMAYSYELFNGIIVEDTKDKYYTNLKNRFEEFGYNKYGNCLEFTPALNLKSKYSNKRKNNVI